MVHLCMYTCDWQHHELEHWCFFSSDMLLSSCIMSMKWIEMKGWREDYLCCQPLDHILVTHGDSWDYLCSKQY